MVVGDNSNNGGGWLKNIDRYDTPGVITLQHPGLLETTPTTAGTFELC